MDNRQGSGKGTLIIGVLLVALGIVFLLASLLGNNVVGTWWPLFIIVVGLLFFVPLFLREASWGAFAIPGSVLTMTGLVLLFQNFFDAWQTWAYAWALIAPFSVGVGLYIFGTHATQPGLKDAGGVVMKVGLVLFLLFGFFFEGLVGVSGSLSLRIVWPILLILLGVWIMLRPVFRRAARTSQGAPAGPQPGGSSPVVWSEPAVPAPTPPASPAADQPWPPAVKSITFGSQAVPPAPTAVPVASVTPEPEPPAGTAAVDQIAAPPVEGEAAVEPLPGASPREG